MAQPLAERKESVDIKAVLAQLPLLNGLPDAALQRFAEAAQIRRISKGKLLYLQDDAADWFYLILRGWIKLFRETLEGSEAIIDVLTAGHLFGENAVFEGDCYSYAVEVVEDAEVIALPTTLLKAMIPEHNQLALNMLSSMSRHRLQQHRDIEHLNMQNAPQRIGCFLLRLCKADVEGVTTLHLPYDKTLIAARLGMKPETFSRALTKLRSETGIQVSGATVCIRDFQRLVRYSCNHCSTSFPCGDLH